jgi:hypothetical protein
MTKKIDYGTFEEFIQKITNPSTPPPEKPKSLDDGRLDAYMRKIGVIK